MIHIHASIFNTLARCRIALTPLCIVLEADWISLVSVYILEFAEYFVSVYIVFLICWPAQLFSSSWLFCYEAACWISQAFNNTFRFMVEKYLSASEDDSCLSQNVESKYIIIIAAASFVTNEQRNDCCFIIVFRAIDRIQYRITSAGNPSSTWNLSVQVAAPHRRWACPSRPCQMQLVVGYHTPVEGLVDKHGPSYSYTSVYSRLETH